MCAAEQQSSSTDSRLRWYSTCSGEHLNDGRSAVEEAVAKLKLERSFDDDTDNKIDFCVIVLGSGLELWLERVVTRARELLEYPSKMITIVGSGVIGGGREREQASCVSLLAGSLPPGATALSFAFGTRRGAKTPYNQAAWRATEEVFDQIRGKRPSFLLFGDPFSPLPEAAAFVDECEPSAVVVGGVACPSRSGQPSIALDGSVLPCGSVAGVALIGVDVHSVTAPGAVGIGPTMRVTQGRSNLIAALDHKPALEKLRDVAIAAAQKNPRVARLLQSALLVGLAGDDDEDFMVRAVVGATPDGALAIADESVVAGDTRLRVHVRDAQAARRDLDAVLGRYALERTFRSSNPPFAAFLVSCAGRGKALFGGEGHDTSVFSHHFPDVPLAGLFANGEIGPVGASLPRDQNHLPTRFHGFTSVFALFVIPDAQHESTSVRSPLSE